MTLVELQAPPEAETRHVVDKIVVVESDSVVVLAEKEVETELLVTVANCVSVGVGVQDIDFVISTSS